MPFLLWWHWLPIVCAAVNEIMLQNLTCTVQQKPFNRPRESKAPASRH